MNYPGNLPTPRRKGHTTRRRCSTDHPQAERQNCARQNRTLAARRRATVTCRAKNRRHSQPRHDEVAVQLPMDVSRHFSRFDRPRVKDDVYEQRFLFHLDALMGHNCYCALNAKVPSPSRTPSIHPAMKTIASQEAALSTQTVRNRSVNVSQIRHREFGSLIFGACPILAKWASTCTTSSPKVVKARTRRTTQFPFPAAASQ